MPDGATGLNKKVGPLTTKMWLLSGLGIGAAYYIYSRIKNSSSAALPASATGVNTAGGTIPGNSITSSAAGSGLPVFSSIGDWMNSAIPSMTSAGLDPQSALNAINDWLNGSCISQAGYNALGSVLTSQGLPPGYSTQLPPLSVCATSAPAGTTTPTTTTTAPATEPIPATPAVPATPAPSVLSSAITTVKQLAQSLNVPVSSITPNTTNAEVAAANIQNGQVTNPHSALIIGGELSPQQLWAMTGGTQGHP